MAEPTRRMFLTHASAAATAGALAGGLTGLTSLDQLPLRTAEMPTVAAMESDEGLIAHVRNVSTGEIALIVGSQEIIHRDRSLAARLVNAAHSSPVR